MNDLCADIGYKSINHAGEELCGDHVDVVSKDDGSTVIVLADGLGSGVQASILSTLTSKIISTMMAEGLSIEECVSTIAATLPVTGKHGVAYSTFTIINLIRNHTAELIQYDNPEVIFIRDSDVTDYPMTELHFEDKTIYRSTIRLQEGDIFVAMSDGCPHANADKAYNNDWKREDIAQFVADMSLTGYTAKVLCTMLVDECDKLYGYHPLDDATAAVVRIRKRGGHIQIFRKALAQGFQHRGVRIGRGERRKLFLINIPALRDRGQHELKPGRIAESFDRRKVCRNLSRVLRRRGEKPAVLPHHDALRGIFPRGKVRIGRQADKQIAKRELIRRPLLKRLRKGCSADRIRVDLRGCRQEALFALRIVPCGQKNEQKREDK